MRGELLAYGRALGVCSIRHEQLYLGEVTDVVHDPMRIARRGGNNQDCVAVYVTPHILCCQPVVLSHRDLHTHWQLLCYADYESSIAGVIGILPCPS